MTAAVTPPAKMPKHLWVVGIVAVLWNAMGVMDFTLTELKNETYLKAFTPEQLACLAGFPLWAVITWGAGVYGGFIGSILLLACRRWAVPIFLISVVGAVPDLALQPRFVRYHEEDGRGHGRGDFFPRDHRHRRAAVDLRAGNGQARRAALMAPDPPELV